MPQLFGLRQSRMGWGSIPSFGDAPPRNIYRMRRVPRFDLRLVPAAVLAACATLMAAGCGTDGGGDERPGVRDDGAARAEGSSCRPPALELPRPLDAGAVHIVPIGGATRDAIELCHLLARRF